jgi:hypothetical protein
MMQKGYIVRRCKIVVPEITKSDLAEFLEMFLRPKDFTRLKIAIEDTKDFKFFFKMTESINDVQHLIISRSFNRISIRFIPNKIANTQNFDTLAPSSIIFVTR